MSGLGTVQQNNTTFLSLAGGYVWNRKADESNPNFATQNYETSEGTKTRQGARYADLTGNIVGVEFKTHDKFGESINVAFEAGGESYTIAIATNNRYSQDMMKALLKIDLQKEVYLKPYDFVDREGRRAQGVVFKQDGEKINLRNEDAPSKESAWFKTSNKKQIKRFFEDLTEWFIAEVEANVIPQLSGKSASPKAGLGGVSQEEETQEPETNEPEAKEQEVVTPKVSPLKMKKALKEYIAENYEDETLPKLSKEDLVTWYNLALAEEELPFSGDSGEVASGDLDSQLSRLFGKQ